MSNIANTLITTLKVDQDFNKLTDEELVKTIVSSNDTLLFEILYDRYARMVYNKCRGFSKSDDEAEDLTNETIVTRETISAIEAKLPKEEFIRIHRSFIVALSKISSFTNEQIVIKNKSLTISRSYKNDVLELLKKF